MLESDVPLFPVSQCRATIGSPDMGQSLVRATSFKKAHSTLFVGLKRLHPAAHEVRHASSHRIERCWDSRPSSSVARQTTSGLESIIKGRALYPYVGRAQLVISRHCTSSTCRGRRIRWHGMLEPREGGESLPGRSTVVKWHTRLDGFTGCNTICAMEL